MFTPFARLFILLFLAIASVVMAMQGQFWPLVLATLLSLYILWDYAVNNTVPLAFRRMQNKDFDGAERALGYISKPEKLSNANSAKYYAIKGMIAHHRDEFEEADRLLQIAISFPSSDKRLRLMLLLTLTDVSLILRKNRVAKDWFEQMDGMSVPKSLEPTILRLQEYIQKLNKN